MFGAKKQPCVIGTRMCFIYIRFYPASDFNKDIIHKSRTLLFHGQLVAWTYMNHHPKLVHHFRETCAHKNNLRINHKTKSYSHQHTHNYDGHTIIYDIFSIVTDSPSPTTLTVSCRTALYVNIGRIRLYHRCPMTRADLRKHASCNRARLWYTWVVVVKDDV